MTNTLVINDQSLGAVAGDILPGKATATADHSAFSFSLRLSAGPAISQIRKLIFRFGSSHFSVTAGVAATESVALMQRVAHRLELPIPQVPGGDIFAETPLLPLVGSSIYWWFETEAGEAIDVSVYLTEH